MSTLDRYREDFYLLEAFENGHEVDKHKVARLLRSTLEYRQAVESVKAAGLPHEAWLRAAARNPKMKDWAPRLHQIANDQDELYQRYTTVQMRAETMHERIQSTLQWLIRKRGAVAKQAIAMLQGDDP